MVIAPPVAPEVELSSVRVCPAAFAETGTVPKLMAPAVAGLPFPVSSVTEAPSTTPVAPLKSMSPPPVVMFAPSRVWAAKVRSPLTEDAVMDASTLMRFATPFPPSKTQGRVIPTRLFTILIGLSLSFRPMVSEE